MLAGLATVYIVVLLLMDGFRFETRLDEIHFWKTTESHFVGPFPPSADSLRSYPEIITPLSYIIWGQLHRLTSDGIFAGRVQLCLDLETRRLEDLFQLDDLLVGERLRRV